MQEKREKNIREWCFFLILWKSGRFWTFFTGNFCDYRKIIWIEKRSDQKNYAQELIFNQTLAYLCPDYSRQKFSMPKKMTLSNNFNCT